MIRHGKRILTHSRYSSDRLAERKLGVSQAPRFVPGGIATGLVIWAVIREPDRLLIIARPTALAASGKSIKGITRSAGGNLKLARSGFGEVNRQMHGRSHLDLLRARPSFQSDLSAAKLHRE